MGLRDDFEGEVIVLVCSRVLEFMGLVLSGKLPFKETTNVRMRFGQSYDIF